MQLAVVANPPGIHLPGHYVHLLAIHSIPNLIKKHSTHKTNHNHAQLHHTVLSVYNMYMYTTLLWLPSHTGHAEDISPASQKRCVITNVSKTVTPSHQFLVHAHSEFQ